MKQNETPSTLASADERVLHSLRAQQRGLKWLTGLAVAFWVLAVIGGIGVLVCYSIFYQPKEKQIMSDYEKYGYLPRYTNSATGSRPAGPATPEQALGLHFTLSYVVTKGLLAVAVTVIILACGTLTTLLLVVLNRRVTLKQINHSLAQISDQLRQLQQRGS
ncbi:MAG TPA: hypothetical protein VK846_12460 [Candidatus Limnocylindria bacterium]|nr:hypothetical protein [Candidatus Limnocylindria bacterium]